MGQEKASRSDYAASEDDHVLVDGISNDRDSLGYFGFAYFHANPDVLRAIPIGPEKRFYPLKNRFLSCPTNRFLVPFLFT